MGGPFDNHKSEVRSGDYLIRIDGVELKADVDFFPLLAGKRVASLCSLPFTPQPRARPMRGGETYLEL